MDAVAKVTSKGQITIPIQVREALGLKPGDSVVFRVDHFHAVLARTDDFIDLAGSVKVPASKKGAEWEAIRDETRQIRARERH
ncbi:MAG: AbrB/MazE/SpoVT family DNA-binding domain-containing protein [Solirubrobacterales bacterium]